MKNLRKNMKINLKYSELVLAVSLIACSHKNKQDATMNSSIIRLTGDSIAINETINVNDWICTDRQLIIQSSDVDTFFYSYSWPDLKFQNSFGRKGGGPEEFVYPHLSTDRKDMIYVYDNATHTMTEFGWKENAFFINRQVKNNSKYLVSSLMAAFDNVFITKNANPNAISLSTLRFLKNRLETVSVFEVEKDLKGESSMHDFAVSNYQGNIALVYERSDRIRILKMDSNDQIHDVISEEKPSIPGDNIWFYSDIFCDEDYLYALYQGVDPSKIGPEFTSTVKVFDWSGKQIVQFELGRPIQKLLIDRDRKFLYALSPLFSEFIFRYNIADCGRL